MAGWIDSLTRLFTAKKAPAAPATASRPVFAPSVGHDDDYSLHLRYYGEDADPDPHMSFQDLRPH